MSEKNGFGREAERRIDDFYRVFAASGEAPPAARYRLEGFLEAGLLLALIDRQSLQGLIDESRLRHLADSSPQPDSASSELWLPLRWRRAPVYPG